MSSWGPLPGYYSYIRNEWLKYLVHLALFLGVHWIPSMYTVFSEAQVTKERKDRIGREGITVCGQKIEEDATCPREVPCFRPLGGFLSDKARASEGLGI